MYTAVTHSSALLRSSYISTLDSMLKSSRISRSSLPELMSTGNVAKVSLSSKHTDSTIGNNYEASISLNAKTDAYLTANSPDDASFKRFNYKELTSDESDHITRGSGSPEQVPDVVVETTSFITSTDVVVFESDITSASESDITSFLSAITSSVAAGLESSVTLSGPDLLSPSESSYTSEHYGSSDMIDTSYLNEEADLTTSVTSILDTPRLIQPPFRG